MRTNEGDLLDMRAIAKLTGIAYATLRSGGAGIRELPVIEFGRLKRYRRADVERWIESHTRVPFNPRLVRSRRA